MKVKIGDKIYSSLDQPIMIILTNQAKENIANMIPENKKYCEFPEGYDVNKIKDFMK